MFDAYTYWIVVVLIIAVMIAAMILLWKICRWILIPLQIALFVGLLAAGYQLLVKYGEQNPHISRITRQIDTVKERVVQYVIGEYNSRKNGNISPE